MGKVMVSKCFSLSALFFSVSFWPGLPEAGPIPGSSFAYGNWSGEAFFDDETRAFTHCAVSASYVSGDQLIFSIERNGVIAIGVASPALKLVPGAQFPVSIIVDNRRPYYGTAFAMSEGHASVFIDDLDAALDAFRRGRVLTVEGVSMRGQYYLDGTFHALERLTRCAISYYSFMSPAPTPTLRVAQSSFDQSKLYQVATQTIASFGVRDFEFATAQELADAGLPSNAVRWVAHDFGMTATIIALKVREDEGLRESDGADTEFLARQCSDDYVSSARNLDGAKIDIRELRVMCAGDINLTEHYLNKFRVGDHHVYTWFEFRSNYSLRDGGSPQKGSESASIVAASFLLD